MRGFVIVVDQRQQIHFVGRGEQPQYVIRANAVSSIRGVRKPVCEKKNPHAPADSGATSCGDLIRMTRARTPALTTESGTGLMTTEPAPTMAVRPTSAMITAALPIHAPAPMRTRVRRPCCSRLGTVGSAVPWVWRPLVM